MNKQPAETSRILLEALRSGLALHQAGDLSEAVIHYRRVLDMDEDQPDALHYLGVALHQGGGAGAAIELLERAVLGKPESAEAHNHLGCALVSGGRADRAEAAFQRACELNGSHAEAYYNLGEVLRSQDRLHEALPAFERAVDLAPSQVDWLVKLAETNKDLGRLVEANNQLEQAIALEGMSVGAYFQRSQTREFEGRGAAAIRDLIRCAVLAPANMQVLNNFARARMTQTDTAAASRIMERATILAPSDPIIRYNLANCLLANGDLKQGWREYRWRHLKEEVHVERWGLPPEWDGGSVLNGGLLIYQEQGIGDEIRFASCLADVAIAAQSPCLVECDSRLISLYERSFSTLRFIAKLPRDAGPPTSVDFSDLTRTEGLAAHSALGELPSHVRPDLTSFSDARAYLRPATSSKRSWRAKLDRLGPGLKIGFLWRSGFTNRNRAQYYFTIQHLQAVFALPGIRMVNLQYDECEEDLRHAETEFGIEIYRPEGINLRDDLDDLSALISELDVVIGPMTSVLSLAGAVGTRCIGLNIGSDWTSLGTDYQPWTPAMSVILKGSGRTWWDAVEEVAAMILTMTPSAHINEKHLST